MIAAQMYTLRDHCKTDEDLARTCQKVADMGFEGIQGSAGAFSTISAEALKKILDDTGLSCVATHKNRQELADIDAVCDYHQRIGCTLTALGSFNGQTRQEWIDFAKEFNDIAAKCEERGLRVGYHNHSHEFAPFGLADDPASISPDSTPLNIMLEHAPSVWLELDTYWVAMGGGDPAAWIKKCKGRIPAIHVKDMTVTPKREHKMCEVGLGNLNWPAILDACDDAGADHLIIERDAGDLDPFESLRLSRENLVKMGAR